MNKRNYLIKESLKKKIKSKWFLGVNIFIFLMIMVTMNINGIVSLFGGDFKQEYTLYVKDEMNVFEDFKKDFTNNNLYFRDNYIVEESTKDLEELKKLAENNKNIIILNIKKDQSNYMSAETFSKEDISVFIKSTMQNSLNKIKYNIAIKQSSIDQEELKKVNAGVTITNTLLKKEAPSVDANVEAKRKTQKNVMGGIVVVVFILPFFFLIVTLVQMIGAEINEEKTNKSMEIIISNVKPKDHLISKIVSCTSFTFIQILLIVIYFLIANLVKGSTTTVTTGTSSVIMEALKDIITPDIIHSILRIIPLLIIFFIFTFTTYAIIAGVLASVTTSIDDFQQLQTPLMLIISLGFYLAILSIIFEGSTFIKAMSFVPLISFLLSPSLYMLNQISLLSMIISIIIQIIFTFFIYHYGLRIYKEGILNYSGTNLWKKIFKAMKK